MSTLKLLTVDAGEIDRGSRLPLWRQCARVLRERIERGDFAVDAKMPAEWELAADLGVSKSTVRKALELLREEGLIETVQGWGSGPLPRDRGEG